MTKAYSKDLREKIVSAYLSGEGTIVEIAEIFSVSVRSVKKYLKQYRDTGDLTPGKSPGRPVKIDDELKYELKNIITEDPDGRLEDYAVALEKKSKVKLAISSIWNACKAMNIRRKKSPFTLQREDQ